MMAAAERMLEPMILNNHAVALFEPKCPEFRRVSSNDRVHRPPARGRHARLEAEAPDDIFECDLAPLFRGERGIHGDPVGAFDIDALKFAQMQVADPKSLYQKRADLRLFGSPAGDRN